MLDDNLEINIWSQSHCKAGNRLTTAERILYRVNAFSDMTSVKTVRCTVRHDFACKEVQAFIGDRFCDRGEDIVDRIVYII